MVENVINIITNCLMMNRFRKKTVIKVILYCGFTKLSFCFQFYDV